MFALYIQVIFYSSLWHIFCTNCIMHVKFFVLNYVVVLDCVCNENNVLHILLFSNIIACIINLLKNSLTLKRCSPIQNPHCEKVLKLKEAAKKWLWWYRLMPILIKTIQVHPSFNRNQYEIHLNSCYLNFCHQPMPSQPFLGCPLWFHNFYTLVIFEQYWIFF